MGKESGPVAPGNPREAGQWEQGPAGSREDQSSEEGRCMALQRGPGGWRNGPRQCSEAGMLLPELLLGLEPGNQQRWKNKGACCLVIKSCLTFCDPMDWARQVPLPMRFPRQEHQSGLPRPPSGDLPDPGTKPASTCLTSRFFATEPPWKSQKDKGSVLELQPRNAVL